MSDKIIKSPQIRFAGFTDALEQRKAEEIFKTVSDKGHPELPVLSASQQLGMVRRDENGIDIQYDKKSVVNYKRVLPKQFVIHLRSFQGGFAHSSLEGITSPAYTIIDFKSEYTQSDLFWNEIFTSKKFIKKLETVTYGIRDGRSISFNDFKTLLFNLPSYKEQEQIAGFFNDLKNLITLHQRKLELLKDTKKSLLQKMFPKDGANVPEIRFAGFTDAWEQRRFEKVFDVHTDFVSNGSFQALKDNVKLYHTENYAYMIRLQDASNNWKGPWLYTDKKGFEFLDKSTVYENDILMSDRGTIGKFFMVPQLGKPMTLSSNAVLLRSSKNDNYFIYYLLNTREVGNQIKMRTTPGAQPMISKTKFKQITAKIPRLNEQIKIGSLFKQLDDTITLHQRELNSLKNLKKSLLQQMFV